MREVYKKVILLDGSEETISIYGIVSQNKGEEEVEFMRIRGGEFLYTEALTDYYHLKKEGLQKVSERMRSYLLGGSLAFTEREAGNRRYVRTAFVSMVQDLGVTSEHHAKGFIRAIAWETARRKVQEIREWDQSYDRFAEGRLVQTYFQKLKEKPYISTTSRFHTT